MRVIDLSTWNRREHFLFFSQYSNPFTGITANIDSSHLYADAKRENFLFSLGYHFAAMGAVNDVENLRIRIENDLPVIYDSIMGPGNLSTKGVVLIQLSQMEKLKSEPAKAGRTYLGWIIPSALPLVNFTSRKRWVISPGFYQESVPPTLAEAKRLCSSTASKSLPHHAFRLMSVPLLFSHPYCLA